KFQAQKTAFAAPAEKFPRRFAFLFPFIDVRHHFFGDKLTDALPKTVVFFRKQPMGHRIPPSVHPTNSSPRWSFNRSSLPPLIRNQRVSRQTRWMGYSIIYP